MPCDARTKLGEIECQQLVCTSSVQREQSTQTKPSSSGQTCLAGDQIQPRHRIAKWILVSQDLAAYAECLAVGYDRPTDQPPPRSPREAQGLEVWMQKGNEAPGPGHSPGNRALPPQGVVMCTPGKRWMPPNHPSHVSQVAVAFVFPSLFMSFLDPKSQAQSASGPALSQATSGTLLALQGFNQ